MCRPSRLLSYINKRKQIVNKSHKQPAAGRSKSGAASQKNTATSQKSASAPTGQERKGERKRGALRPGTARIITYLTVFAALFAFLYGCYGDVLARAEQESYISTSPDTMYYLLSQPWGRVYWLARWVLLLFKWPAAGAAVLALVYTLTTRFADYALRMPRRFEGAGILLALGQTGWILYRGTSLYFKNEPSQFIVIAFAALAVTALLAAVVWTVRRVRRCAENTEGLRVRPYGALAALALTAGTTWAAWHFNENEIITARLQNMVWTQQWDDMIAAARSAKQPTRTIAAYHAVALVQTDQLLEGMFDIPYEYPKARLHSAENSGEYNLFLADCNFYAGIPNIAYRNAMDIVVMNGPRLVCFKRMAICALLNGEKELCRKYLSLVGRTPFESAFVEKYTAMLNNPKLIDEDEELKHVKALYPREDRFEQNYRSPLFLGYNVGLSSGSEATLLTSVAACLYSKDLQSFLPRAQILAQKGKSFPACMQQAIAIMALKQPELLNVFPQVGSFVPQEIRAFLMDAKPYAKDRLALRHELRDRWLGTYVYYYYTENNDPEQVVKSYDNKDNAGVN